MNVNAFARIVANWKSRCVICATHGRKDTASKKNNGTVRTNPSTVCVIIAFQYNWVKDALSRSVKGSYGQKAILMHIHKLNMCVVVYLGSIIYVPLLKLHKIPKKKI